MDKIADAWTWIEQHPAAVWLAAGLALVATASFVAVKVWGSMRGRDFDAKASFAFAAVQVGVAIVMVTGTYEFFASPQWLNMPQAEAIGAAVIIELCTWVCIGMIWTHVAGTHLDPKTGKTERNYGTGPGGWGFGITSTGGGTLAVIGAASIGAGVGRAIIVMIGVTLWWMKILTKIRRRNRPGKFMYSPYRLARRWGWIQVTDDDMDGADDSREWRVRRLSTAMRRAAHQWDIIAWWGNRQLTRLSDGEVAAVLAEAQERYAVGYVIRKQLDPTSQEMASVIERARRALAPADDLPQQEQEEPVRVEVEVGEPVPPVLTAAELAEVVAQAVSGVLAELPIAQPAAPAPPPPPEPPAPRQPARRTTADAEANQLTVKWIVSELVAGRRPTVMAIRKHGGSEEKPRSENWALARRNEAMALAGKWADGDVSD